MRILWLYRTRLPSLCAATSSLFLTKSQSVTASRGDDARPNRDDVQPTNCESASDGALRNHPNPDDASEPSRDDVDSTSLHRAMRDVRRSLPTHGVHPRAPTPASPKMTNDVDPEI